MAVAVGFPNSDSPEGVGFASFDTDQKGCGQVSSRVGFVKTKENSLDVDEFLKLILAARCWRLQDEPTIMTMGPVLDPLWEENRNSGGRPTTFRDWLRENAKREACFDWLDAQPERSVLYICFGSIAMPSAAQVRELAAGLERSGQRFLWVLRTSETQVAELLPPGFLARTVASGIVYTRWAPQLHILAHRSVGGFLSHCGWNSAVEAMVLGVPIIAMPVLGDQMVNATLIAQLGIGIRVNEIGAWWETIGSSTLGTAIQTLMTSSAGNAMRTKVAELSDTILQSVRPGGSSRNNLTLFLQHLKTLKSPTLQP